MTAKSTQPPVKVAICFPSGPMVHVDFMISTALMMKRNPEIEFVLINNKSPNIALSRNACVAMAQDQKADYLFFLDSDMDVPSDTITRLLSHKKDVIGANYRKRMEKVSFAGNEDISKPEDLRDNGILRAGFMPTGCLLVKMSVFDHIRRPYFFFGLREYDDKEEKAVFGEDYVFSLKVLQAGYELWFDMDVTKKIKHVGQLPYKLGQG